MIGRLAGPRPAYHIVIDLHLHTTASDGRLSPAELVDRAARAGLTVMSVTDHDTVQARRRGDRSRRHARHSRHSGRRDHRSRRWPRRPHARLLRRSPRRGAASQFLSRQRGAARGACARDRPAARGARRAHRHGRPAGTCARHARDLDRAALAGARAGPGRPRGLGAGSLRSMAGRRVSRPSCRGSGTRPFDIIEVVARRRRHRLVRPPGRDEEGRAAGAAGRSRPGCRGSVSLRSPGRDVRALRARWPGRWAGGQRRLGLPRLRRDPRHSGQRAPAAQTTFAGARGARRAPPDPPAPR